MENAHFKQWMLLICLFHLPVVAFADKATSRDRYYIGVSIVDTRHKAEIATTTPSGTYFINQDYQQVPFAASGSLSSSTIGVGLNAGWSRQKEQFVYGIEADFVYSNKSQTLDSGNTTYLSLPAHSFNTVSQLKTAWYASLRPIAGYVYKEALFYMTAGVALSKLNYTFSFSDTNKPLLATANTSTSKIKLGWTAGAGVEYPINQNWSVKMDYLFYKFSQLDNTSTLNGYPEQSMINKTRVELSSFRIGINRQF